jgi:hypothetical protein
MQAECWYVARAFGAHIACWDAFTADHCVVIKENQISLQNGASRLRLRQLQDTIESDVELASRPIGSESRNS